MKVYRLLLIILVLSLSGCSILQAQNFLATQELLPTSSATSVVLPTETIQPALVPTVSGDINLQVWVPPQFDPESGTPAGILMKERLADFTARKPNVQIDVRVKEVQGPGGLLNTLETANSAAQLALPDLVILPSEALEPAVDNGLLYSFENLSSTLDDPDWYSFARQMARVQEKTYGIPIAGDALIQLVRSGAITEPAENWNSLTQGSSPLAFPADDPEGLFTLAQYQANKGIIRDEEGNPTLDVEKLTEVLSFYQQANSSGIMPFWLTGFQTDDQIWNVFQEGQANQVITWSSRFLANNSEAITVTQIPTSDGLPFTLGNGWLWTLTSPNPENHEISVQLAEFMTESDFLAKWTEASGFLPPRSSSFNAWSNQVLKNQLEPIARTFLPFPSTDVIEILGPLLQKATVDILKQQSSPSEAAQTAADSLK